MKLHHIGVVVPDIQAAAPWWSQVAGFRPTSEIVHDPIQKVMVQFFEAGGTCIELIQPASDASPVTRFLNERGGGLYHLCFEVPNLDQALAKWRESGAFLVTRPEPAVAFGGRRIAFLITPQRVLMELVEAGEATCAS